LNFSHQVFIRSVLVSLIIIVYFGLYTQLFSYCRAFSSLG